MGRTYVEAPAEMRDRVGEAMKQYHKGLRDAKVTVNVLLAKAPRDDNDDPKGFAIEVRGHRAMACIKVTSLKDRAAGLADAVLIIDGDNCETWDEPTWDALLDHELSHLELKLDEDGGVQRDDLGRPKLKTRPHDFELGGFYDVSKRHREWTPEVVAVKDVFKQLVKQGVLQGF